MNHDSIPRFVSFRRDGKNGFGVVRDENSVIDLTSRLQQIASLREAIAADALFELAVTAQSLGADFDIEEVELLPVVPDPQKIICVGANFPMAGRPGADKPKYPVLFARFRNTLTGHNGPLAAPPNSSTLDYEGELAIVIGREATEIDRGEALRHVAGFTCFNDATVRGWQSHSHQFTPAKNYPRTASVGPALVPAEFVSDYRKLRIVTRLNGAVVQDATAAEMIFDLEEVVAYCSSFTTLCPGDIIALGSPDGFGATRSPPLYLKPGDRVEVDISQVGRLINDVSGG